jgi:serine/threonine-protein kinase
VLAGLGLEDGPALTLDVLAGPLAGQSFPLAGHSTFLVGRGPGGVHLALEGDPGMSRVHFLVEFNPPYARLADMRSKNGTFVNGARVQQLDLRAGDRIRAGNTTLQVRLPLGEHTLTAVGPSSHPTLAAEPLSPSPSRRPALSEYELEAELGRGGMGVVYRARRLADGQAVALKTVLPAVAPGAVTLARFEREMAILRQLTHPHIVRFLDSGESGGLLYLVMEYIDGPGASRVVKQDGPMAPGRVVTLGCQLLDALAHAHAQGFIHRDVKPANLLLAGERGREVLKLADFGLGYAYQESAMSGLTLAGAPGGTPGFMTPEQVLDFRNARPAADQYAAAASLYYLLTGQAIYESESNGVDLLMRILNTEPIPLRRPDAGPPLPDRLGAVLRRALDRDPQKRYPDVVAMREALAAAR